MNSTHRTTGFIDAIHGAHPSSLSLAYLMGYLAGYRMRFSALMRKRPQPITYAPASCRPGLQ